MRNINGLKEPFTYSEFRRVEIQPFSKNLKIFSVRLLKQNQQRLWADSEKFLSANHYYNSHIVFWHDFGCNRKNIFRLCFLPRRTQRKCQLSRRRNFGQKKNGQALFRLSVQSVEKRPSSASKDVRFSTD